MRTFILCESRHPMPVQAPAIFPKEIPNPMDFAGMEEHAKAFIGEGDSPVVIYVTGLTPALIASINACKALHRSVTLMHFDRESGQYVPQEVL